MAIQQQSRLNFSSGRIYAIPPGALYPYLYPDLVEASVDFKIETKEAFAEGAYAITVATGHKAIEIMAKHYTWTQDTLANDFSIATGTTNGTNPWAVDEAQIVSTSSNFQLTNGATYVPGTLSLIVAQTSGGFSYAQTYQVASTSVGLTAGVNAFVSPTGAVTFAAGDNGKSVKATYSFANTSTGGTVTGIQTFQNSDNVFKLKFVHRDRSPIDNSTGETIWTFNNVRCTGFKAPYKEGEFVVVERTFKPFQDYFGNVWTAEFVNL